MDLNKEKQEIEQRLEQRKKQEEQAFNDENRLREIARMEQELREAEQENQRREQERLIVDKIVKGLSPIFLKVGKDYIEASKFWFTRDKQIIFCAETKNRIAFAHLEDTPHDNGELFCEKYWQHAKK
jgi:hypothetical protein